MYVLGDIIKNNAIKYKDKVAAICKDSKISYKELDILSTKIADSLMNKLGISAGERICIISRNSIWYLAILFGIWKAGAIAVPVNWRLKAKELEYVLQNCEPVLIFHEEEFVKELSEALGSVLPIKTVAISGTPLPGGMRLDDLMRWGKERELHYEPSPEDIAMIMYTSGTTGRPKGVIFTHARELADLYDHLIDLGLQETDVMLWNMPWFHNGGLTLGLLHTLIRGATGVIYSGSFVPEDILYVVEKFKITALNLVPTMLARLIRCEQITQFDLSTVGKIYYGASPIPHSVQKGAMEVFSRAKFYQTYGQTESGMLLVLRPEDHYTEKRSFTGRPLCLASVKAVIDSREARVGEVGELICRQKPLAMPGYWRNEEATREVLRDGWLHTTDLARVEEHGYYTIVGRLKDMIITGGENVYAKEVENVIMEHPSVEEVAVFGLPDEEWGEIVCAAIVVREGKRLSEEELLMHCSKWLAGYKKPRRIFFMNELPKNAAGKVLKDIIREIVLGKKC